MMIFELKKVFSRTSSKVTLFLLALAFGITCYFAVGVSYVNEEGETEKGFAAVRQLRMERKEWAGLLTEDRVSEVIRENARINATPEGRSTQVLQNEIAYSWKQGIADIRDIINDSFAEEFRTYDYYKADSLTPEEAVHFYPNRIRLLQEWLDGEAKDMYSDAEKEYLIKQYQKLKTPLQYDYSLGWHQLFEYFPTIIMISVMLLGYLVASIFSCEFSFKSDAVFYSSYYGRDRATIAKIKAGFCIVTGIYWGLILLYTGFVLLYLGADGANCPIQVDKAGWKNIHNIVVWQEYLLIVLGGYLGSLFMSFLTMLVSAKAKSAVPAVIVPFGMIFLPSFIEVIHSPLVGKLMGVLPDRLLQTGYALSCFDLYTFGGKVISAIPILVTLYGVMTVILPAVIYREYTHKQIG